MAKERGGWQRELSLAQKERLIDAAKSFLRAINTDDLDEAQRTTLWMMDVLFEQDRVYVVNRGWNNQK